MAVGDLFGTLLVVESTHCLEEWILIRRAREQEVRWRDMLRDNPIQGYFVIFGRAAWRGGRRWRRTVDAELALEEAQCT